MEFRDPQVAASCDEGPVFCSLRVPEVFPSRSTGPPIHVGSPDFSELHAAFVMRNIAMNLPKFWENDVRLWLVMVENIFVMRKIASEF